MNFIFFRTVFSVWESLSAIFVISVTSSTYPVPTVAISFRLLIHCVTNPEHIADNAENIMVKCASHMAGPPPFPCPIPNKGVFLVVCIFFLDTPCFVLTCLLATHISS